jgi:outer membrane protein assembly factor BamB
MDEKSEVNPEGKAKTMFGNHIATVLVSVSLCVDAVSARAAEPGIGHPEFTPTPEHPVGFRGDGSGRYATRLAVTSWSAAENVIWKADIGFWGDSGPVPAGDRVYTVKDPCELVCVNDADGKILWRFTLDYAATLPPEEAAEVRAQYAKAEPLLWEQMALKHKDKMMKGRIKREKDDARRKELEREYEEQVVQRRRIIKETLKELPLAVKNHVPPCGNSYSTPVTDGQHVWAIFANGVLGCVTREGEKVWARDLGDNMHCQGYAHSPRLVEGKLIIQWNKAILGLDAKTGETVWTCRALSGWCTPVPHEAGGESLLVCPDGRLLRAHDGAVTADPKLKRDRHNYGSPIVVGNTYVFVDGHHFNNNTRALVVPDTFSPDARPIEAWKVPTAIGGLIYASPVCRSNLVFGLNERGALGIWKADTGELVLKKNIKCPRHCYASLIVAGDQLIATSEMGDMVVLKADAEATEIGRNKLPALVPERSAPKQKHGIIGTPAVAAGRLYVRAQHYLYCIGRPEN